MVIDSETKEQIVTKPPLLVIEILSADDTISEYDERISDYLGSGVSQTWVFHPSKQKAWSVLSDGSWKREEAVLMSGVVEADVKEVFRLAAE